MTSRPFEAGPTWARPSWPLSRAMASKVVGSSVFSAASLPAPEQAGEALVYKLSDCSLGPGVPAVCALGSFDGLHLGHRALLDAAAQDAKGRGVPLVAVTFDPDPSEVLLKHPQERLLPTRERIRSLASCGADALVVHRFSREFAAIAYDRYLLDVLGSLVRPVSLHVGSNFRFGAKGAGTPAAMAALGKEHGFDVTGHDLVTFGGRPVSSTRTRALLRKGDVAGAAELLDRAHYVSGRVEHGRGEGTSFGFPTANVTLDPWDCIPANAVYAGYFVLDGRAWPAAINVGTPPSFKTKDRAMLEANLIGFSGDIYGASARVVFLEKLRPSRRFDSLAELERTVLGNIAWVRDNLGDGSVEVSA